jgi:protein-tyrosine phosphatase
MITHKARKIRTADFGKFDLIFAMDKQNYEDLVRLSPDDHVHKIRMFREFDPQGPGDVPDPWFGGDSGFEVVMHVLMRGCESFLDHMEQEKWVF